MDSFLIGVGFTLAVVFIVMQYVQANKNREQTKNKDIKDIKG